MYKAKIYGRFAVKFRALGIDFGYVRKELAEDQAHVFEVPFGLPGAFPVKFKRFGIELDAMLGPA